jgi:hypothetical protein
MLKPNTPSYEELGEDAVSQGDLEKLMQLVFSRPIYLEPPDEPESENEESETEPGREAPPQ